MAYKFKLKWGFGNRGLSTTDKAIFGIPALRSKSGFVTCPKAGACAPVCYARQGRYYMPNVANNKEHNLRAVRNLKTFIPKAIADLKHIRHKIVRIHDAGDFYSQEYLDAWYEIARQFPEKFFYAYTKSLHLDLWSNRPENFKIGQSMGGTMDDKINKRKAHSRIFTTHADRRRAGYIDGNNPNKVEPMVTGERKIGLVYHGQKKLSDAQKDFFS
jgi:hypothetical protein